MSVRDLMPWSRGSSQAPGLYRSLFGRMAPSNGAWPSVEFTENDKEIRVMAEVPGLKEDDIEIMLEEGVLTLRGEKKSETEDKDRQFSEALLRTL